ncbi:ABC transporter ATP-binding protein [Natronomonas salsuginis]|uniref:Nickel import system ATP-binding protein NikD n=1 Tax=Natronomonas salsuginis TaxID=2217661 RepID=A0A4U5J7Q9_9EURY|nr:ABC transporter ATP-binding protein [Natronomonas salsuginis]TKR24704.1 ABC transporter ATP-binding protein [Natronomonas salsuginis]
MTLLEVENLHTEFPMDGYTIPALDDVSLSVSSGEIVGVVGESGSGKTVLAESVMGIVEEPGRVTDGEIRFKGESLLSKTESELQSVRGSDISLVFQDPMNSLNPTITVGEQVAETIRLHQDVGESVSLGAEVKRKLLGATKHSESWKRSIEMLETVGIPEPASRASSYPHEFSGGMRQRALIAIALSCEPDLLIADEPTTALDVTTQAKLLDELEALAEAFDTAVMVITHDLAVVAELCEFVYVMYAGEVVERARTERLFRQPQHPYTVGLLDSIPHLDGSTELGAIPGDVPERTGQMEGCLFAPRCPEATQECHENRPSDRSVGDGEHSAACLKRGESQSVDLVNKHD